MPRPMIIYHPVHRDCNCDKPSIVYVCKDIDEYNRHLKEYNDNDPTFSIIIVVVIVIAIGAIIKS